MATEKDTRISEVEYCISSYFNSHFSPLMNSVKNRLQQDQAKEIADYQMSFGGIMSSLASASNPAGSLVDNSMTHLRYTGEHCSKTAEDYVVMCKDAIAGNKDFQDDLLRLAGEWRNAVIAKVGRARYDSVCETLGCDLAIAYIDHRIEQMMIDKMVRDTMPKSSFEYVMKKGAENCLIGLPQAMMKSPLEAEIDARGEAAYNPSGKEKTAARAVSFGADVVSTGGFSSWGALVKLAGAEVVFAGVETYLDRKGRKGKELTVDEIISESLFGVKGNVLATYRKNGYGIKAYEDAYIQSVNGMMTKRMNIPTEKPFWEIDWQDWNKPIDWSNPTWGFSSASTSTPFVSPFTAKFDRLGIPSPIAPGKEQEYLDWKAQQDAQKQPANAQQNFTPPQIPLVIAPGKEQEYLDWLEEQEEKRNESVSEAPDGNSNSNQPEQQNEDNQSEQQNEEPEQDNGNEDGWASLLENFGLNGMSDIGRNLPYVIAMLPDMLIGLLTGKTESV